MRVAAGVCIAVLASMPAGAWADPALCAQLAASPLENDPRGSVPFAEIDGEAAVKACSAAAKADPGDVATAYRLARAFLAAGRPAEAVAPVQKAAAADYRFAYDVLGWMHYSGSGVPQDNAASFAAYSRARELGLREASRNVAWFHRYGVVVARDATRAAELLREAAEAGSAEARHDLALMLRAGDEIPADPAEALALQRAAAEQGFAAAQSELALRYFTGDGVPRDDGEAARLARRAAEQGDGYGAYLLGFAYEQGRGAAADRVEAFAWYGRAAAAGSAVGQNAHGRLLEEGGGGITADPVRAREAYVQAAEAGVAEAQARLGRMLRSGTGGPADLAAARDWLARAPSEPISMHQRGLMAWRGEGEPADPAAGLALVRQAADAGLAAAQVDAAEMLTSDAAGAPPRDEAAALAYLEQAVAQDHGPALFRLGDLLLRGEVAERDIARAVELLDRAAALGVPRAGDRAHLGRERLALEAQLAQVRERQCALMIELCNRGCVEQPDGRWIYNTRDGQAWFEQSGRLIPQADAPDFGCPQ